MKRIIAIALCFVALVTMAAPKPAVSMVSYGLNSRGDRGFLELKNETTDTIYNASFVLKYMAKGGVVEHADTIREELMCLCPGDTINISVPAHVCADSIADEAHYIPEFEFLQYNRLDANGVPMGKYHNPPGFSIMPLVWFFIGIIIVLLILWVVLLIGVIIVAREKKRSKIGWALIAILITPLIAIIILACLPKNEIIYIPR